MHEASYFKLLFVSILVFTLNACNNLVDVKANNSNGTDANLVFAGVISITNKTDSTLTLNWTPHAESVAYDIFDNTSGTPLYLKTIAGQFTSTTTLTDLTPSENYKFRVRMKNLKGLSDSNKNDFSVTMNAHPDAPGPLALVSPTSSPGVSFTPTIKVSGVKHGDKVRLFTDDQCSVQASDLISVPAGVTEVNLVVNTNLIIGNHTFYAASINQAGILSDCSSLASSIAYSLVDCPSGYIPVEADTVLDVPSFCVMKFEAKCATALDGVTSCTPSTGAPSGAKIAVSTPHGIPWNTISANQAITACQSLNALNSVSNKYDLISNAEWMAIARNIESVNANWSTGTVSSGQINRGHSDNAPANALVASADDEIDNCTGTGQTCNRITWDSQRRTHELYTGKIIWDFAGDLWEWTDWFQEKPTNANKPTLGPTTCAVGWSEPQAAITNCSPSLGDSIPLRSSVASPWDTTLSSVNGVGQIYSGVGGAPLRSGGWNGGASVGIFALYLDQYPVDTFMTFGFRCVYRP